MQGLWFRGKSRWGRNADIGLCRELYQRVSVVLAGFKA